MRVIAGSAKGHKLQTIEGLHTRPTTDRIKETLFNIIAFDLPECRFLDLFSGSSAIGIEALSRGAVYAVFVEQSAECQKVIDENLEHTKLKKNAMVMQMTVETALDKLSMQKKQFDMIFMDPPYAADLTKNTLQQIADGNLLAQNGIVIVEHSTKNQIIPPTGWCIYRKKDYKTTTISFLCVEETNV